MTKATTAAHDGRSDPFGGTSSERLKRRFAGAGAATLLLVTSLAWWVPLIPLIACAVIYVVGVPVSFWLERRWPTREGRSPIPRYVLIGAAVGFGCAIGLALPSGMASRLEFGWILVFAVATVPAGAIAGGTAAWGARSLPDRWLVPTAVGGVCLAIVITVTLTVVRGH